MIALRCSVVIAVALLLTPGFANANHDSGETVKSTSPRSFVSGVVCPQGAPPCAPVIAQHYERIERTRLAGTRSCLRITEELAAVKRVPTIDPEIFIEQPEYRVSQAYFQCERLDLSKPVAAGAICG